MNDIIIIIIGNYCYRYENMKENIYIWSNVLNLLL